MPGKFQKPLFNIRAHPPKQYRAFNPQDPLYDEDWLWKYINWRK